MTGWQEVWARRGEEPFAAPGSFVERVARALALDGYDSATAGGLGPLAMAELARWWGSAVGVRPGDGVYEVGCGAGAFLACVGEELPTGALAGCDFSPGLVAHARTLFPELDVTVGDAVDLSPRPVFDHVVACGVFMYLPDTTCAAEVLDRMAARAGRTVSVLDVPDLALRDESERYRRGSWGAEEYERRYRDLPHLYFDRSFFVEALPADRWEVDVAAQAVEGYPNSTYRFNVVARRRGSTAA